MENYNEFMEDFKNYLIAIKNLSESSVKKIFQTVQQFLGYINNYKFENKYNSVEEINLNDIRTLTNNEVYSYVFYLVDNDYKPVTRSAKVEYLRSFFDFLFRIKHKLFKQPFKKIQTLGHSTVDVTKIYTHLYNKEVEDAIQGHPLSKFKYNDALAYAAA